MIFGSPAEDVSVERGDPVRLDFEVRSPLADSQISGDSIVKIRDQMMEIDVSEPIARHPLPNVAHVLSWATLDQQISYKLRCEARRTASRAELPGARHMAVR